LDIRKQFFSKRVVLQWHSCPGSGGHIVLEVFQWRSGTEGQVSGHSGMGWVGLEDLGGLFQSE